MINWIINRINRIRWNHFKWKKIGKSYVGKNYSVISPDRISIGDNFYAEDNLKIQAWTSYQDQIFDPIIDIGCHGLNRIVRLNGFKLNNITIRIIRRIKIAGVSYG